MISTIIFGAIGLLLVVLLFKFFTGKGKPSDQRTSFEKLACSLFSIFMKNVDDLNNSIRTATVLKDEALQEVNRAISNLK